MSLNFTHHNSPRHRHVRTSTSTNTELMNALQNGSLDTRQTHLLTADIQTAGRGQRGRSWQSPAGNVYLSLYHPMTQPLSGMLSLMVGYQVMQLPLLQRLNQGLATANLPLVGVKWANDIGFYKQNLQGADANFFYKLSGILIEPVLINGKLQGVIVGLGLNVDAPPILDDAKQEGMGYQAVGLAELAKQVGIPLTIHPSELYAPLASRICHAIAQFEQMQTDAFLAHQFMEKFADVDILQGKIIRVENDRLSSLNVLDSLNINQTIYEVLGIALDGGLRLQNVETSDSEQVIYTGKIDVVSNCTKIPVNFSIKSHL